MPDADSISFVAKSGRHAPPHARRREAELGGAERDVCRKTNFAASLKNYRAGHYFGTYCDGVVTLEGALSS